MKMKLAAVLAAYESLGAHTSLVDDEIAFRVWLDSQAEVLEKLETERARGWLTRQLAAAGAPSQQAVVEIALDLAGKALPAHAREAIATGVACLRGADLTGGYPLLLATVRTVASALISRAVGYEGPISGWERGGRMAFYLRSSWWRGDDTITASQFAAVTHRDEPDVAGSWPTVTQPSVPDTGLVGLLKRFAGGLASKTDGRVYADLRPVVGYSRSDSPTFEFVLRASRRPTIRAVLFLATSEQDSLLIRGWKEPVVLREPREIVRFVRSVAEDPSTVQSIERLMLASLEIDLGA